MILFVLDIDNTLTRSEWQHQHAYVAAMHALGILKVNDRWKDYTHHTDSFILKENYERNKPDSFSFSFIHQFEPVMLERLSQLKPVTPIDGAINALQEMNRAGVAHCFATGSLLTPALLKLQQAGIPYQKEVVAASNPVFSREEIVEHAILKAKRHYQVDSFERIVSVGDGVWDLKTARNLGLEFIGIGEKNLADFTREGCKHHHLDWTSFDINLWLNNNP